VVSYPQVFPPKPCIRLSSLPYALQAPTIIHLDFVTRTISGEYRSLSSSLCSFLHSLKSQVTQHIKATLFIHQLYFLRRLHTKHPLWHTNVLCSALPGHCQAVNVCIH
jgi:hypothetical protein